MSFARLFAPHHVSALASVALASGCSAPAVPVAKPSRAHHDVVARAPAVAARVEADEPPPPTPVVEADELPPPTPALAPPDSAPCSPPKRSPLDAACDSAEGTRHCASCPSYTGFAEQGNVRLDVVLQGSFSGPFEEALVRVTGCEAHLHNYGGLLLTRKIEGGWVKVFYLQGVVPVRCEAGAKLEGASRVACLEAHGLNGGTYETSASVLDFRARRMDQLLSVMCEDGIDVERVRFGGAEKRAVRVGVAYGVQRDNDGQGCVDVRGQPRHGELRYAEEAGGYAPTGETVERLRQLKPPDPDFVLDPAVAAATGAQPLPPSLLPGRADVVFGELFEAAPCVEPRSSR